MQLPKIIGRTSHQLFLLLLIASTNNLKLKAPL